MLIVEAPPTPSPQSTIKKQQSKISPAPDRYHESMKRWLGRLWQLAKATIVLVLLALALWAWVLPVVVGHQIENRLRAAGATEANVKVHRIGWRGAEIGSLTIGRDHGFTMNAASLAYEMSELRGGHVDEITLSGAQLAVSLTDGRIDLGEVSRLNFGGTADVGFPFDRINLQQASLLISTETGIYRVPVQGLITAAGDSLTFGLVAEGLTQRARLSGQINRTADGWQTDNLRLFIEGGDTVVGDHTINNWRANLTLRAAMNDVHTRIGLAPGSRLQADRVNTWLRDLSARVGSGGVGVTIDRATGAWEVAEGSVQLSASALDRTAGPARAGRLGGTADLRVTGDRHRVQAWLDEPTAITVEQLQAANLAVTADDWQLQPTADRPLLAWEADHQKLTFAGRVAGRSVLAESTVPAENDTEPTPPFTAGADELAFAITGSWSAAGHAALGQLQLNGGWAEHETSGASAEGVTAVVPVAINQPLDEAGRFNVERLLWDESELTGPSGTLAIADGQATLTGHWQPTLPTPITLTGHADAGSLKLVAELKHAEIVDPLLLSRAIPALSGWEIDGGLAGRVELSYDGRIWQPLASLELDDLAVRSREYDAQLSGINGTLTVDRFSPPLTPPSQRLTIDRFDMGELQLTEGSVGFRIESSREVLIERMRWSLGEESEFRVHGFRFNLDDTEIQTDIFVEQMNMNDWLAVLTDEAVSGTGQLHGRIPVIFRPHAPRNKLVLGDGFLYTNPGSGTLRVRDPQMVSNLLNQADRRFESDAAGRELRDQTVQALTDFEYSMVTFDLVEAEDDVMLRIETRGKGRHGGQPLEIGSLVINVRGFGDAVNLAMFVSLSRQQAVDRALDTFFKRATP